LLSCIKNLQEKQVSKDLPRKKLFGELTDKYVSQV